MPEKKNTRRSEKKVRQSFNLRQYMFAAVLGLNVFLVLANILILSFLPKKAEDIVIARSEILAHQLQEQSAKKLAVDLKNSTEAQALIYQTLPTKDRLLEVIKVLESLNEMVKVRNFMFDGDIPIKDSNDFAFLPLSLNLEGSLQQTMAALSRLQKTPFLFTIDQTALEIPDDPSQNIRVEVFMRLYVSEQFAQN